VKKGMFAVTVAYATPSHETEKNTKLLMLAVAKQMKRETNFMPKDLFLK
jgi:hypothetical protein